MPNVYEPVFDEDGVLYGRRYRRARIGYQAGCQRLGLSLWELSPGHEGVYHYHYANEELLAVLGGRPSLRTPAGWRELAEGEVVAFPRGARGAHAVADRTEESVRLLFFSEMRGPEVVIYPDEGSLAALEEMSSPERGGFAAWLSLEGACEWHEGESPDPSASPAAVGARANLLFEPSWDAEVPAPFDFKAVRLARRAGSQRLGATLYEVAPGGAVSPLHTQLANEELVIALAGPVTFRTPEGERVLAPGEVVACPTGREGAHQLLNRGEEPARVLVASTMQFPEVAEHLDSGKVLVATGPERSDVEAYRRADAVEAMLDEPESG